MPKGIMNTLTLVSELLQGVTFAAMSDRPSAVDLETARPRLQGDAAAADLSVVSAHSYTTADL